MSHTQLRWGILGAGLICADFCIALSTLPYDKHCIEHVAARDTARAERFAAKFNAKRFSCHYEKVVTDPNVDVVYIGTINTTHKDLSILAMNHGKAVLCEKPATMNSHELEQVMDCAKKNNVFFMEAVWTRCFPLYHDIISKRNDGTYGDPNVLFATFGVKDLFSVDRISNPLLGGSVLLDIGIYVLTIADMIFEGYKVKEIKACGHVDEETGIDRSIGITITYEGNRMVQLMANGDHDLANECEIYFSNGKVRIMKPFWCPEKYIEEKSGKTKEHTFKLPVSTVKTNFVNSTGLSYEADHVRECLMQNQHESSLVSHSTSERIMGYLDEIRAQLGMKID